MAGRKVQRTWLRYAGLTLAWLAVLALSGSRWHHARVEFATRPTTPELLQRADGQSGHTTIDFGGQWLMGRMVYLGQGHQLYHRQAQWPVLWQAYPIADESRLLRDFSFPVQRRPQEFADQPTLHDAEALMYWFMGADMPVVARVTNSVVAPTMAMEPTSALLLSLATDPLVRPEDIEDVQKPSVGGPLYPPIHGLLMAPWAMTNQPRQAYAAWQTLSILLTWWAGWQGSRVSWGRVPVPVAILLILAFPGYRSGLDLGQNQVLSLGLLLTGWAWCQRGYTVAAGIVWGLLAFKPVWAVTFLAMPLLLGQLRMVAAMILTAGLWILISLPLVGISSWFDWLAVGREATALYDVNESWITLSRDLSGLVRRVVLDFSLPDAQRDQPWVNWVCRAAYATVAQGTLAVVACCWKDRSTSGTLASFLALGSYLSCFHFMYYDALLALLSLFLALSAPGGWWLGWSVLPQADPSQGNHELSPQRTAWPLPSLVVVTIAMLLILENYLIFLALKFTCEFGWLGQSTPKIGGMPQAAPAISFDTTIYTACDTVLLALLWCCLGVGLVARQWMGRA